MKHTRYTEKSDRGESKEAAKQARKAGGLPDEGSFPAKAAPLIANHALVVRRVPIMLIMAQYGTRSKNRL